MRERHPHTHTPQSGVLAKLIGQPRACRLLESLLAQREFPPLLFAGQPGIGKRTTALLFAQAALCGTTTGGCGSCQTCISISRLKHPDVRLFFPISASKHPASPDDLPADLYHEYPNYSLDHPQPPIEPQASISVDVARWIRSEASRPPLTAPRRIFIILHAHRLTAEATGMLLKTLEETGSHTVFVLCTHNPTLLPRTIVSRLRMVRFTPVPAKEIITWLQSRLSEAPAENSEGTLNLNIARLSSELSEQVPQILKAAAALSEGSPGLALRYAADISEAVPEPVIFCYSNVGTGVPVSELVDRVAQVPSATLLKTLITLYREALKEKLRLENALDALGAAGDGRGFSRNAGHRGTGPIRTGADLGSLLRSLQFLHRRLQDAHLSTNPALTSYTLIWALDRLARPHSAPPASV